jgi:hypothetical protein
VHRTKVAFFTRAAAATPTRDLPAPHGRTMMPAAASTTLQPQNRPTSQARSCGSLRTTDVSEQYTTLQRTAVLHLPQPQPTGALVWGMRTGAPKRFHVPVSA